MKTDTKERPMPMSAPEVRGILSNRQTQFRRVAKNKLGVCIDCWNESCPHNDTDFDPKLKHVPPYLSVGYCDHHEMCGSRIGSPWKPGDLLWVKETFDFSIGGYPGPDDGTRIPYYRATWDEKVQGVKKWRSSIHMPRWASRITLEITSVRVERLQGITEDDVIAEGVLPTHRHYVHEYQVLWESINRKDSWALNPWVWVIEFVRVEPK